MTKIEGRVLTPKQRKFAEEYCIDLNAIAAYLRVGYAARGLILRPSLAACRA
jgi:phage terminase small subunit